MNKSIMKKYYYKFLAALTGLLIGLMIVVDRTLSVEAYKSLENSFFFYIFVTIICTWAILTLFTSIYLLFSSKEREDAFLIVSNTQVRDELEQKALSDSIKSTFIFNIVLFSLIYILSGISLTVTKDLTKKENQNTFMVSFSLPSSYSTKISSIEEAARPEMTPEDKQKEVNSKLIPKEVFSPSGLLFILLLQFVSFKSFLFLNRRALS